MTEIPAEFAGFVEVMRHRKQDRVESATTMTGGGPDITPVVDFWRDGDLVATALCDQVQRDAMFQALQLGVCGYAPDEVRCAIETYGVTQAWADKHHRAPDPGELQRIWERGNPGGFVRESLWLMRITRAGHEQMVSLQYQLDRKTRTLTWDDDYHVLDNRNDGERLSGMVPRVIREMLALPPIDPADSGLRFEEFGIDADQARIHQDVANTQVMTYAGFIMAMAARDEYTIDAMKYAASTSAGMRAEMIDMRTGDHEPLEHATQSPSFLDAVGPLLHEKLQAERKANHRAESEHARQNRAQRRAAARGRKRG